MTHQGKDDFMGRCVESPVVKLKGQGPPAPRLLWEPVKKGTEDGGEILVAFELFLVSVAAFSCGFLYLTSDPIYCHNKLET